MDRLRKLLDRAYAFGEEIGAFRAVERRARVSQVDTLCGLILGQRIAFKRASDARQRLFQWTGARRESLIMALMAVVQMATSAHLVREYLGDEPDIQAILAVPDASWAAWNVDNSARDRVRRVLNTWMAGGLARVFTEPSIGVGSWTKKAFGILCRGEDHLLHEDKWVRKRWMEFCTRARCPPYDIACLEREPGCARQFALTLSFRQLSMLLWRITPAGVRQAAANPPSKPTPAAFLM